MTLPRADQADCLFTSGLVYPARPGWRAAGEASVTEGQADWGDLGACLRNNVLNYNRLDQGYYYDIPHIKAYYPRNRSKHDAISL